MVSAPNDAVSGPFGQWEYLADISRASGKGNIWRIFPVRGRNKSSKTFISEFNAAVNQNFRVLLSEWAE
jgi:hypothetical protein